MNLIHRIVLTLCAFVLIQGPAGGLAAKAIDTSDDLSVWHACGVQADCVLRPGLCGYPAAVNRHFVSQYDAWRNRTAPAVDCAWMPPPAQARADCIAHVCTVVPGPAVTKPARHP